MVAFAFEPAFKWSYLRKPDRSGCLSHEAEGKNRSDRLEWFIPFNRLKQRLQRQPVGRLGCISGLEGGFKGG